MKRFEILEHISDIKIKALGKNKKELFLNALLGMQEVLRPKTKKEKVKRKIKIKSLDLNSLLVDFLAEINYLNEINKEVYQDIKFIKFSNTQLEGEISGQKVERFGLVIKGVTYHGLNIHQRKDQIWEATILFDI